MNPSFRHLRPLLISLVALVLTAGIALAGKPSPVGAGRISADAAKTVPTVTQGDQDVETDTDEDADAEEDAPAVPESDAPDHCTVDPTTATPEALALLNHGAIVCWAAHQETPEGYANHGAFVSEWARKNHGADAADDASAKGAEKAAAKAANGANHGRGHSSDQP